VTLFITVGAVILLALYDVFAFARGGTPNTISFIIITWSKDYPIIPLAFGILMGHFFWQLHICP
jgi:hypothetical protein